MFFSLVYPILIFFHKSSSSVAHFLQQIFSAVIKMSVDHYQTIFEFECRLITIKQTFFLFELA